jgi:hypothetical protein
MARIGTVWVMTAYGYSDRSIQRAWLIAIAKATPSTIATAKPTNATLVDSHRASRRSARL